MRDLQVGDTAPGFTLQTSTGATVSLLAYRGRHVVIHFVREFS